MEARANIRIAKMIFTFMGNLLLCFIRGRFKSVAKQIPLSEKERGKDDATPLFAPVEALFEHSVRHPGPVEWSAPR
jgi:hypothetical protein